MSPKNNLVEIVPLEEGDNLLDARLHPKTGTVRTTLDGDMKREISDVNEFNGVKT